MKTSNRIVLNFTLFVILLNIIFASLLNAATFLTWYFPVFREVLLKQGINLEKHSSQNVFIEGSDFPSFLRRIPLSNDDLIIINKNRLLFFSNISYFEDSWLFVEEKDTGYIGVDVTPNIEGQKRILLVCGFLLIFSTIITYFLTGIFVRRNLRDIYKLSTRISNTDIKNLKENVYFTHLPDDDEINVIAKSIDNMKIVISNYINSMQNFVSHVSHEFKTPLMIMQSNLDIASKNNDYSRLIEDNNKSIKHLNDMLDSLLLMSNIQSEKEYNIIEYDIGDIVEDICIEMRKKYHQKKIKLYYNKKHKLINVNLGLFVIIIRNLIDNSYKYTADKGTIIIKLNDSCITIEDTGIGISSNYLDNIWEPFWQEDKNNNDGVGLGLSLVQKIIEIFGWNIIIESKKGKGTTIFIYFTS